MSRRFLSHSILACALTLSLAPMTQVAFAQSTTTSDEAHKTKEAAKDAADATADAAKHAAKTVTKSTKKAAKATKKAVTPDTTTATCKDGTVQTGKTKETACIGHGGV
jgi:hypothetical protein